jgi:hypothetical protein
MTKSKFRFKLTDKDRAELKHSRLEHRSKLTLAYQLGFYVGEQIVNRNLPTLSVDMIHTRTNISVTCAEGDECRRLNEIWYGKRMSSDARGIDDNSECEAEWNEMQAYHKMLEDKYLDDTIECRFQLLNIRDEDMEDFKKGLGHSLWDCDCSHYSTKSEDIEVKADEDGWFTIITLKRSKD